MFVNFKLSTLVNFKLSKSRLVLQVRYDKRTGSLQATALGRIASHYYITHSTLATFNEHLKPSMGDIELLRLFALADEFKYMVVRVFVAYLVFVAYC